MNTKPLVYVAGPYTHPDPVENTHNALAVADSVLDKCNPVVPHLSMFWHLLRPHPLEFWYELDLALLERCDALIRLPGESSGADAEVAFAVRHRLPVFNWPADNDSFAEWAEAVRL